MGTSAYSRSTFADPSSPNHANGVVALPHSSTFPPVPSHSSYSRSDGEGVASPYFPLSMIPSVPSHSSYSHGVGGALSWPPSMIPPVPSDHSYSPSESSSSSPAASTSPLPAPTTPVSPLSLPVAALGLHRESFPARLMHAFLLPFAFIFHMFTAFLCLTSFRSPSPFSFFSSSSSSTTSSSSSRNLPAFFLPFAPCPH